MGPVLKEIKEVFNGYKNEVVNKDIIAPCEAIPFICDDFWFYYYLFPEVLLVAQDDLIDLYKSDPDETRNLERWIKDVFTNHDDSLCFYPCWVCSEEQVLRIMAEHGLL